METPKRTQKEIAQSYRGNLAYLRKLHPFRTFRTLLFLLVVAGSVGVALGYRYIGRKEFFSTGTISSNHAQYANRCEVCHEGADPDLLKAMDVPGVSHGDQRLGSSARRGTDGEAAPEGKWAGLAQLIGFSKKSAAGVGTAAQTRGAQLLQSMGSLSQYDAACLKCHQPYQFHQPAASALLLREFYNEIGLVHAGSCSTCHREHEGPEKMKLPASNNCRSCHNDPAQLAQGLMMVRTAAQQASPRAEIRTLKSGAQSDGVRRFIPPREVPHQPVAFASFAGKHPAFGYEASNLSDPAHLKYNHSRHRQDDVVGMNNRLQIDCIQCHKLGADGVFMQRVEFNNDCRRCHSLTFDPEVRQVEVPHGRPSDVRTFLQTLGSQYLAVARQQGIPPERQREFVQGRLDALIALGYSDSVTLERRVFFEGERPPTSRITTKSNTSQAFPACTKCHDVPPAPGVGELPKITPTNVADRWLTRGPFTHAPHLHMQCVDCHSAALASSKTTDILMPAKGLCADCHRPSEELPTAPAVAALPLADKNAQLVAQQRKEGGIAAECASCHGKFHAPAGATVVARGLMK